MSLYTTLLSVSSQHTPIGRAQAQLDWSGLLLSLTRPQAKALAYLTAPQAFTGGVAQTLSFNLASFNLAGVWDPATPSRFTATSDGFYHASAQVSFTGMVAGNTIQILILVNGIATVPVFIASVRTGNGDTVQISADLNLNEGDFVEFQVQESQVGVVNAAISLTWGSLVRVDNLG